MEVERDPIQGGQLFSCYKRIFSSDKGTSILLVMALFLPLFFHGFRFGIPYVKGGDEPHYLIMINSLLMDGDWDLKNNYEAVWHGAAQAGKKYAGLPLDSHAAYQVSGRKVGFKNVYDDISTWKRDEKGVLVPRMKNGVDPSTVTAPSSHPYGMALFLSCVLWPFRNTALVEPLALGMANLAVILSAFLFREVIRRYRPEKWIVNSSVFLVYLGTPLWAYGRTLFNEPFLVFFGLAAYWAAIVKKSGFWSGLLLGAGMAMKPTLCLLVFPLVLLWLARKEWLYILRMSVGPCLALALYLYLNNKLFGSPFRFSDHKKFGDSIHGILGLCFSWNHGIVPFMPIVIPVLFSWRKFIKEVGAEAWVWGGGFLLYFLLMADVIGDWYGGWCYGPRQIVPVIPFLMIPVLYSLEDFSVSKRWFRWFFVALCLLSFCFNALGAMDGYWDSHPLTILTGNVS